MLNLLVKRSLKPIMIVSLIALTMINWFGIESTLMQEMTINGIRIKVFNLHIYLNNISNAFTGIPDIFSHLIPQRGWETTNANMFDSQFWNTLINNLALIFDYIYMPLNFILMIIRGMSWIITILLAIMGWNVGIAPNGEYYSQLIEILKWTAQNLAIPYI